MHPKEAGVRGWNDSSDPFPSRYLSVAIYRILRQNIALNLERNITCLFDQRFREYHR